MKFRAHRDVVAACTRQAEGHARCNRGLPRFRVTRRHPQVALETVCAIAAIVIDRLAALTVRGRIKPLAGRSKALLVGHTATPEGSPAAARAGRESHEMRGVRSVPFWNTCRPTQRQMYRVSNDLFSTYYTRPTVYLREEFYRDPMREARTIFSHRTRVPFPRFVPVRFIVASLGGSNSSR